MVRYLCGLGVLCAVGCSSGLLPGFEPPKRLLIPEEMKRSPPKPGGPATASENSSGYVIRLAEGGRVWEMELPESTGGYEMRIPLSGNGVAAAPTAADVEMLAGTASAPDGGVPSVEAKVVAGTRSYLGTLAKVNEMYASRRYELALIELVELERQHPEDARIQAMKGSLYLKLQKPRLAREAWQRALTLNPGDEGVAEALRELSAAAQE